MDVTAEHTSFQVLHATRVPTNLIRQNSCVLRPEARDPHHKFTLAWHCYQKLRAVYHVRPEAGRRLVAEILDAFPTCPILEVARRGRTLRRWRSAILAYFDTDGASNGPTEATNGVIETMRRVACGFRNFDNYRLRALLAAGGHRPWRQAPNHTQM